MTANWVTIVALFGWLILATAALRARRINARKAVTFGLIWGAIFLAVTAVFSAIGQR